MKRLLTILIAALAIAGIGAVSAFALENPEILPNPTAAKPVTFTATSGTGTLATSAATITCSADTVTGSFTSTRLGTANVDFTGCKSSGFNCNTSGDAAGTILLTGAGIHLVAFKNGAVLALGLAITPAEVVVTCAGIVKLNVKGTAIGEVTGIKSGVATTTAGVVFAATSPGVQKIQKCELDKAFCEGKTYHLEANFGTGFKEASEETTEAVTFGAATTVDF